MNHVREETVESFSKENLLKMIKENLDELGVAYREEPGGFGGNFSRDPKALSDGE